MLIQALMRGDLASHKSDLGTLEHCLLCRSCEAVCPSKVPYGEIITLARDEIKPKRSKVVEQLMDAVAEPRQMHGMLSKLKFYQKSGMQKLVAKSGFLTGGFKAAEGMLKFVSAERLQDYYPAKEESQGDVLLFTGCMGESFDQKTVKDAIFLLNGLGFGVKLNHPASCCGAMHHHNGEVKKGAELKSNTREVIANIKVDAVIGLAGSCIARMNEGDDSTEPLPMIEITNFIATHVDKFHGRFSKAVKRVALHQPCPTKNLLNNFDRTIELLNQIPDIEILLLPTYGCCGASGSHMVSDAGHARKFLIEAVEWLDVERPDLIVSQNMGCMLHLTSEMEARNMAFEVVHPLSLLRRTLPDRL